MVALESDVGDVRGGHDRRGHPIAQTESEELKLRQDQRVMWEKSPGPTDVA
jgi:hypothetical protein